MKIAIAYVATTALAAAALATAPAAFADPEDDFLILISKGGITWPPEKTALVIETGKAVCGDFAKGASFDQEVADLRSATSWSEDRAGYFIDAATQAFCPEYGGKVS
ncbi:MAG: DUF732 domain-containing protein [Actinomycetia bacterium]|nr:DUF732 domain-containing protein [Actinomycetes bacterium]